MVGALRAPTINSGEPKNQVEQAFSSIDVILKKRWDLIPNLISVAKNYMKYEQETLEKIVSLRSQAMSSRGEGNSRIELENQLSGAIGRFMVTVESYPELKANASFQQIQASLNEVEEQLSASRRFYNTAVTDFNNAIEMFPSSIVASTMNYRPRRLFEATEQARQNVNVGDLFER
ncbi:LemA family protein [Trichothermofontia sichuanensis B231]|uniref:LemA family protein n=1 Tax=Trichothermofontia sichuanensis TaxID=3045816 RepID=UPI0022483B03|nr:LemA family protein [Trichothermofontia sichuanensis]UZQ55117.1 LemA family protein [Trichothermofontia sichuanensis B231]